MSFRKLVMMSQLILLICVLNGNVPLFASKSGLGNEIVHQDGLPKAVDPKKLPGKFLYGPNFYPTRGWTPEKFAIEVRWYTKDKVYLGKKTFLFDTEFSAVRPYSIADPRAIYVRIESVWGAFDRRGTKDIVNVGATPLVQIRIPSE